MDRVHVIGGGLAGCEIAWQLAARGVPVRLSEMKPIRRNPAQSCDQLAELVCSNSFRSANVCNAIGLLKWEMRRAGSRILDAASRHAVPAGDALAVDRDRFADDVTTAIRAHSGIEVVSELVQAVPADAPGSVVICTGPLTDEALAADIARRAGRDSLYFYDAIAPIIDADSIDWDVVWRQSRYDKGDGADYANVPLDEAAYFAFVEAVASAEKVGTRDFEEAKYFEGCLPIEAMIERGAMTLAFGPLKPVGLTDPRTGRRSFAVAQLRMENREASAWNMVGFQTRLKYSEQKRIFRTLPGLERAEFLRFGSVHRNTYIDAPTLLADGLHWHGEPNLWFAGQITGVEGYVESTACGLLVAWQVLAARRGITLPPPPPTTAFGAMRRHLRGEGIFGTYSPSNLNWSLFAPIEPVRGRRRDRKVEKRRRLAERAQRDFEAWWSEVSELIGEASSP